MAFIKKIRRRPGATFGLIVARLVYALFVFSLELRPLLRP